MKTQKIIAFLLLAAAQIGIAVNVIVGKHVMQSMPVFVFIGARFLMSSILLTVLLLISKTPITAPIHPTGKLQAKDWGFLSAQALTGGFLFNFLFFSGVEHTTATAAGIIGSTLPAIIAICAWMFLKEQLTRQQGAAIVLAMLGILVISTQTASDDPGVSNSLLGNFLVFLAMIPEALYSIFNKFVSHRVTFLGCAMVVNWIIFLMVLPLALYPLLQEGLIVTTAWWEWGLVGIGALFAGVFYWAWPKGISIVPVSTAAIFGGVMPVAVAILAVCFLDENFGWQDAAGMACVFAALGIGAHTQKRKTASVLD